MRPPAFVKSLMQTDTNDFVLLQNSNQYNTPTRCQIVQRERIQVYRFGQI